MSLGLVSYGSSDDESETEEEVKTVGLEKSQIHQNPEPKYLEKVDISDDEDDFIPSEIVPSLLDEPTEDILGLSSSKSIFSSLPSSTRSIFEAKKESFIDENEDLSTIPKAKTYQSEGRAGTEVKTAKPKKKGPVRIMAPFLVSNLEEETKIRPLIKGPAKTKSDLMSLLPPPKYGFPSSTSLSTSAVSSTSSAAATSSSRLIPRSVSRKPEPVKRPLTSSKRPQQTSQVDSDDEDTPFFTMDSKYEEDMSSSPVSSIAAASSGMSVNAKPDTFNPRGLAPGTHPSHQFRYNQEELEYGPATAPYPPPPPKPKSEVPDNDDIMANEAALERLAGRLNKRRKQDEGLGNIIDVNFEDIKPDEREWVTKALTEDDDDKPGPRNTIGGNQKRKHQITYLAAMAKENEQNLKKQWAAGAANRRAASSKYGF